MRSLLAAVLAVALFLPRLFLAAALLGVALCAPAFAQETSVAIPWGDWLSEILVFVGGIIITALGAILTWAATFLPATLRAYINQQMIKQAEQLLARAIDYAIEAVSGAAKGQKLSISVGHEVVATAMRYAIEHGPAKLIEWMGGVDLLREKILARLDLEPDASAARVLPPTSDIVIPGAR